MSKSNSLCPEMFTIDTRCGSTSLSLLSEATRYSATASIGSIVAEIPIRCTLESTTESISAKLRERSVPRFDGTSECISSIIIHFILFKIGLNLLLANANPRDSGVVIKI